MSERTCLRCGAPYDEGATVCFTCGASIGELETPTQPVRTPKAVAAAMAAESDTAAQPDAVNAGAPSVDPGSPGMTALAPEPEARRVTVGTSYYPTPPPAPPRAARRGRWALISVVAFVLLAALAGGGYALRVALAGPPVPKSVVYRDPGGRYTLTVPALWTVTRQADGALLTDSSGANSVTISVAPAQAGQTAANIADASARQLGLRTAAPAQIGGDAWDQRAGQVIGQDGATRQMVVFVDVRAGDVYMIQLSSPTASYTTINNLVYQPLLSSFAFV